MINRLLRNDFVKNNGLLFIAGLLTGAVNYALYPVISRVVSIEQFGEVQILLALVTQLSVFGAVVRIFVVNTLKDESDPQVASQFIRNTMRTLAITASGIALLLLAISPWLQSALQFNSIWGLVPTAFNFVLGLLFMIPLALLQARQDFAWVSMLQTLQAFTKLVFAGLLGYLGFGSSGVLWGVVIASIVMLVLAGYRAKPANTSSNTQKTKAKFAWGALRKQLTYITLISTSVLSVMVLLSLDTFIVKYHFSPEEAGLYAGIAVVARTMFFLSSSVTQVMISSVKQANPMRSNHRTYVFSVGLLAILSVPALAAISWFSTDITRILIGQEYDVYSSLLFRLSVAMTALSLINLIVNYHVAIRDQKIMYPVVLGGFVTALLTNNAIESFTTVVDAFTFGILLTLAVCIVWSVLCAYGQHKKGCAST